jgi:hypothetical protein
MNARELRSEYASLSLPLGSTRPVVKHERDTALWYIEQIIAHNAELFHEPHHLGFPVSARTGTYDPDIVMVKREWYNRLRDEIGGNAE